MYNSHSTKKLREILNYQIPHFIPKSLVILSASLVLLLHQLPTEKFLNNNQIWINVFVAVGTISAVVVALILARWGKNIKKKPDIVLKSVTITPYDQHYAKDRKLKIFRLILKNEGKNRINKVHCNLECVKEFNDGKYEKRNNFVSVPLPWTHFGNLKPDHDISTGEEVFLDIVQIVDDDQFYKICWPRWLGEPHEPDFVKLKFGKEYILLLSFYTEKLIKEVNIKVSDDDVTLLTL